MLSLAVLITRQMVATSDDAAAIFTPSQRPNEETKSRA
jgi:hypothetical protein